MHSLLGNLVGNFSMLKNEITYIIDLKGREAFAPAQCNDAAACISDYEKKYGCNSLLPQLLPAFPPTATVIVGNNFVTVAKAFLQGVKTTKENRELEPSITDDGGHLSIAKLRQVDPEFAEYISRGLRCKRISAEIFHSMNSFYAINDGWNNVFTACATECQILKAIQKKLFPTADAVAPAPSTIAKHVKTLGKDFFQMWTFVEPMKDFVLQHGHGGSPLIARLTAWMSACFNSDKARNGPDQWAAWAKLVGGYGRALEALIKMNGRPEYIEHGVCCGMKTGRILSYKTGKLQAKMMELDDFLRGIDSRYAREIEAVPPALAVKVVGELDGLAAVVCDRGSAKYMLQAPPGQATAGTGLGAVLAEEVELLLVKYIHVELVFRAKLLHAGGGNWLDDETLSQQLRDLSRGAAEKRKADLISQATTAAITTHYDQEGKVSNFVEMLSQLGVRQGSTVQCKTVLESGMKKTRLLEKGKVTQVTNDVVRILFDQSGLVSYPPAQYPQTLLNVIELPVTAGGSVKESITVEKIRQCTIFNTTRMRRSVINARLIQGFDQVNAIMQAANFDVDEWVKLDG